LRRRIETTMSETMREHTLPGDGFADGCEPYTAEELAADEPTATCPRCGHTGPEAEDFSWLAAGFNGIEAGDADDLDVLECGRCLHRFEPAEEAEEVYEPAYAKAETVAGLRGAANLLEAEPDGGRHGVLFPVWPEREGEPLAEEDRRGELIRDAARAILGAHGREDGMHTSKLALAALVHYVADMLEE
jgi:hypothetical protein